MGKTEIPGARARLLGAAEAVCASLTSLAERLTPGQVPEFAVSGDPSVDTGTEPPTYLYTVRKRVYVRDARPEREAYEPGLAARAAALLAADGWETTEEILDPRPGTWDVVVTGLRHDAQIMVSVSPGRDEVMYQGRTPAVALYEHVPHVRPDPVVTPETLRPGYTLCYECDGLGWCPGCEGRGWVLGGRPGWGGGSPDPGRLGRCPECLTERVCPICRGRGSLPFRGPGG
ncbi:hypothetical protein AB0L26_20895 [Streptomyces nondiastaticus]|uniref:hypothetical protein n=1 Tax=Streptomyces nondiastaticus TaxID=3154512 RepID=UPI003442298D